MVELLESPVADRKQKVAHARYLKRSILLATDLWPHRSFVAVLGV